MFGAVLGVESNASQDFLSRFFPFIEVGGPGPSEVDVELGNKRKQKHMLNA